MKPPLEQNYYELLEVPRDATLAEIDRAYDRARAYYGAGSMAAYSLASPDELKAVQDRIDEAYLVLADEKARAEYDARTPPAPDERPLHREVRLAREREAQRQATPGPMRAVTVQEVQAQEATARGDKPDVAPAEKPAPVPEPPAPPPAPVVESAPPQAEVPASPAVETAAPSAPAAVDAPATPPPEAPPSEPARAEHPAPPPVPSPPRPKPEIAPDVVFTGELLRRLREGQGLSLQEMADHTKIGKSHLENIEADRHAALPAQVYLRGFLMSYARELRLDPLRVSKSYLEQMAANPRSKPGPKTRS